MRNPLFFRKNFSSACIREEDILQGKLVSSDSYLAHVAIKLTEYTGPLQDPYGENRKWGGAS